MTDYQKAIASATAIALAVGFVIIVEPETWFTFLLGGLTLMQVHIFYESMRTTKNVTSPLGDRNHG